MSTVSPQCLRHLEPAACRFPLLPFAATPDATCKATDTAPLFPTHRWPAPNGSQPQERADGRLGAPLDPWPGLAIKGRPLTAATIRSGPGYLEVPFVATQ